MAGFDEVSPEVGTLDPDAFDELLEGDPDAALGLLAAMTGATDEGLRALARRLAGRMATCLQGALLVRFAPPEVADAFCGSRLGTSYDGTFGTLTSPASDLRAIVERATPTVG